jgi:hypothetical protein
MNDDETLSKDRFFEQLAQISDAMTAAHGKDFAMGALVLAARFIAETERRARAATEGVGSAAVESAAAARAGRSGMTL